MMGRNSRDPGACCSPSADTHAAALEACAKLLHLAGETEALLPLCAAVIEHDTALCGRLLELWLPLLTALAVGLRLPEERWPPGCSWSRAMHAACALLFICSGVLHGTGSGVGERLATAGSLPRLLQAALQLLNQAPSENELLILQPLLGYAARLYGKVQLPLQPPPAQQALQLAQQLLLALQSFSGILSRSLQEQTDPRGRPNDPIADNIMCTAGLASTLLQRICSAGAIEHASLGSGAAWCAGISAAVCLLAPLASAAHSPEGRVAKAAADAASQVCSAACNSAFILTMKAPDFWAGQAEGESTLSAALWQRTPPSAGRCTLKLRPAACWLAPLHHL